jgi:phosphate transport system protein
MDQKHIVKSYDTELYKLRSAIAEMGAASVSQLSLALQALLNLNRGAAKEVVSRDEEVDRLQAAVDELTVLMLAKRQPLAQDLRVIFTGQRIAASLERISDYATNIARHALAIEEQMTNMPMEMLKAMGDTAQDMLKSILEAYRDVDVDKALEIWHRDDEMDRLYRELLEKLPELMQRCTENVQICSRLLFVVRCYERIGDHITNIAESVYYIGTGNFYPDRLHS